jgi:hypothetical protein
VKGFLVVVGAALIGNMIAERFVLKNSPEDPTGFILIADGIGLDDLARAGTIAGVAWLAKRFIA